MQDAFHLYVISFTVGAESGLAMVAAQDEKSAFQILKNGGSRHCDGYSLIQTRDIGMTANCHYGLLLESFVNAREAYDAIVNAVRHIHTVPSSSGLSPEDREKIDSIEFGAEKNVQSDWLSESGDAFIKNKPDFSSDIQSDKSSVKKIVSPKIIVDYVGDLSDLQTESKTSLVDAINEASQSGGGSDPNAVKYTEQSLTDEQKGQARENIGACSAQDTPAASDSPGEAFIRYTEQDLTSSQKTQARTNIGAGTSNFSGSFNDLTDKPESLSLSENLYSDRNSTTKAPTVKSIYDDAHPSIEYSQPAGGMLPNVFYDYGTLISNMTFTLAPPQDSSTINHYFFVFRTGTTVPTITWPNSIIGWVNGSEPELQASCHYEISILNGYAAYLYI